MVGATKSHARVPTIEQFGADGERAPQVLRALERRGGDGEETGIPAVPARVGIHVIGARADLKPWTRAPSHRRGDAKMQTEFDHLQSPGPATELQRLPRLRTQEMVELLFELRGDRPVVVREIHSKADIRILRTPSA